MNVSFIDPTILSEWETFLIDLELARNYNMPYQLICRRPLDHVPNPIVERVLPTLFYIRMVAIFDEALGSYINGIVVPKKYQRGSNLDGKIRYLRDQRNLFLAAADLVRIKDRRNALAHGTDSATWTEVYTDLEVIERELKQLRFVDDRPKFSFFGRSGGGTPVPPDPRVEMRSVYSYGIRKDGKVVRRFSWRTDLLRNEAKESHGEGP